MVQAFGGTMTTLAPLDASGEEEVKTWIDFACKEFGDFDILYNNASAARFGAMETMPIEEWEFTLRCELTLVWVAIKHTIPVFRRRGGGCILNVASVCGMQATGPGTFAHGAAKAGVLSLTRDAAHELAPYNVRVNCISPGMIETPGVKPLLDSMRETFRSWSLNQRIGQVEDIAGTAAFLCSDEAIHITGINIPVDGGQSASPGAGRPRLAEAVRYQFR